MAQEIDPGDAGMDIGKIPALYNWIRSNLLAFLSITLVLLVIYGAYEFIQGYARPLGNALATEHEDLKRAVASYAALDAILQKPLKLFNASRVGLFRMHDSEKDESRMAYFFASIANMVAAPGVEVDLPAVTNVPAITYAKILPSMVQNTPIFVTVKDLSNGPLRELLAKRGIRVALFVPIVDLRDNLIGFIELDWLSTEDVPPLPEQKAMLDFLTQDSVRISGYFSLSPMKDS
jgi:hypothetical protein